MRSLTEGAWVCAAAPPAVHHSASQRQHKRQVNAIKDGGRDLGLINLNITIFWQIALTESRNKREGLYVRAGLFAVSHCLSFHGNLPTTCNQGDLV